MSIKRFHSLFYSILFLFLLLWTAVGLQAQSTIYDGFFDQEAISGFVLPVGIKFDDQGNGFLWEKSGLVYQLDLQNNSKHLILDISEEVASWGDHGLTGLALDPEFSDNGLIYLGYTVDRYHLFNFGTPNYNADSTILVNATIGRVSSYQLDISKSIFSFIEGSEQILVGQDMQDGFPILADFHGVGSLEFGEDGSLLISCGDSGLDYEPNVTYHSDQAIKDGIIDSLMLLGAYRSQSIHSLNGKIIRINPETGDGLMGNPFFNQEEPRSPASRIWALGLRNPYKFIHIPETGSHSIQLGDPGIFISGDVGSSYWEELNLVKSAGQNFGWPLYEGVDRAWPYGFEDRINPFAPNPNALNPDCNREFFLFYDLLSEDNSERAFKLPENCYSDQDFIPDSIPRFIHSRPFVSYNNKTWNQPTRTNIPIYDSEGKASSISIDESPVNSDIFEGFSSLPSAWYTTGFLPDTFHNSLISCDYSGWIKALHFNNDYQLTGITDIRKGINGIVSLAINPSDDCIYYVNIITGELRKICFGGNPPPVAVAKADTLYGQGQLTVQFRADESYDPNQLPMSYFWDFGDGNSSTESNPVHLFMSAANVPIEYKVKLTVSDSLGEKGYDSLSISLNNTPPKAKIISPVDGEFYAVNGYNRLDLRAEVSDNEESAEQLEHTWQVHLHHNTHFHSEQPIKARTFSTLIEPVGCAERDSYWYRINLKVSDAYGLSSEDEVEIFPNCDSYENIRWLAYNAEGQNIILNWEEGELLTLYKFVLQKISETGNISDLGEVLPSNNQRYSFVDKNPIQGENRYRLKIYTTPEKYIYSSIKMANFPYFDGLNIFPNPNSINRIFIEPEQEFIGKTALSVFDFFGHHVLEKEFFSESLKKISLDISELPSGPYVIRIKNEQRTYLKRFTKLK